MKKKKTNNSSGEHVREYIMQVWFIVMSRIELS